MKATGAEITEFWTVWPPGDDWYIDHYGDLDVLGDDDQPLLEPDKKYEVGDLGILCWQGKGPMPKGAEDGVPVATAFAKWRKAKTVKTVVVTVPNADVADFEALCKQRGWKPWGLA